MQLRINQRINKRIKYVDINVDKKTDPEEMGSVLRNLVKLDRKLFQSKVNRYLEPDCNRFTVVNARFFKSRK